MFYEAWLNQSVLHLNLCKQTILQYTYAVIKFVRKASKLNWMKAEILMSFCFDSIMLTNLSENFDNRAKIVYILGFGTLVILEIVKYP